MRHRGGKYVLTLGFLWLITSLAFAGEYQLRTRTSTGGFFRNPDGGAWTGPGGNGPYGSYQDAYGIHIGVGAGNIVCSGTITTVYDWVRAKIDNPAPGALTDGDPSNDRIPDPFDDPPGQVVAVETCRADFTAKAMAGSPPVEAGKCDNGLAFPAVITSGPVTVPFPPFPVIGHSTSGVSDGTRYQLVKGGETVTLTCSPSASASAST